MSHPDRSNADRPTPGHPQPDTPTPLESPSPLVGEAGDRMIQGHAYDGIREYDNPMPGWWVGIFVLSVVFAVVYVLGIRVFGFVDTYEEDLAQAQAELEAVQATYAATGPRYDAVSLAEAVADAARAEAGAQPYATYCASCHGAGGEGLIGPNMTDDYWIHGGTDMAIYEILRVGVPAKGMPPWEAVLSEDDRANLVAFIRSVHGTDPANAKEAQGEFVPYTAGL